MRKLRHFSNHFSGLFFAAAFVMISLSVLMSLPMPRAMAASDQYACSSEPNALVKTTSLAFTNGGALVQAIAKEAKGKVFEFSGVLSDQTTIGALADSNDSVLKEYEMLQEQAHLNLKLINRSKERDKAKYGSTKLNDISEPVCAVSSTGVMACTSGDNVSYGNGFNSYSTYTLGPTGVWKMTLDQNHPEIKAFTERNEAWIRANDAKAEAEENAKDEELAAAKRAEPPPDTRPGILAGEALRPGDLVSRPPSLEEIEAMKPGNNVARIPNGDEIQRPPVRAERRGDKNLPAKPGALVRPRVGENIGRPGIITFNAMVDGKTGRIVRLIYRDGIGPLMQVIADPKKPTRGIDSVLDRVDAALPKAQQYAECCARDAGAKCDQKVDVQARKLLLPFVSPFKKKPDPTRLLNPFLTPADVSNKTPGRSTR